MRGRGRAQALSSPALLQAEPAAAVGAAGPGGGLAEGLARAGGQDGGCECPPPPCLALPRALPVTLLSLLPAARCPLQSIVSTVGPGRHRLPSPREGVETSGPPFTQCVFSPPVRPAEEEAGGTSVSPRRRAFLVGGKAGAQVGGTFAVCGDLFTKRTSQPKQKAQIK